MRQMSRSLRRLAFAAGLFILPLAVLSFAGTAAGDGATLRADTAPLAVSLLPKECEDDCPAQPIACGETLMGTITAQDFQDDKGRLFDIYKLSGASGDQITATLTSDAFEPHLELRTPAGEDAIEAEGQNPGSTARIDYTLTATSDNWRLIVKPNDAGVTGAYSLTLQCGGGTTPPPPPPPSGFFIDPAYPDFQFRVTIGDVGATIAGTREAGCQPQTVCVSGALPGRSELFIRILGPRPNGYLWPTIVRFTPSRVVVEIHQVSSGEMQTYTLEAIPPGTDDLPGLQDRMGFLP